MRGDLPPSLRFGAVGGGLLAHDQDHDIRIRVGGVDGLQHCFGIAFDILCRSSVVHIVHGKVHEHKVGALGCAFQSEVSVGTVSAEQATRAADSRVVFGNLRVREMLPQPRCRQ